MSPYCNHAQCGQLATMWYEFNLGPGARAQVYTCDLHMEREEALAEDLREQLAGDTSPVFRFRVPLF